MADPIIVVEVALAKPEQQLLVKLEMPAGASVEQAIEASGILKQCPEIDLDRTQVGVFGKVCDPATVLKMGDRIEIYRPLLRSPKEARRVRAAKQ